MWKLPGRDVDKNSIVRKTATEIELEKPVDKIVQFQFGTTKACLHRHVSKHVHAALCNKDIPFSWTHFEDAVSGHSLFEHTNNRFKFGTKEVKIGFLANWGQQNKKVEFVVKNLTFGKMSQFGDYKI